MHIVSEVSWLTALSARWGRGWLEQEAVWRWREVVGERLGRLARPLHVERGILHLAVSSPVVANELRLWTAEILARLEKVAPHSAVRDLKFHIVAEPKEMGLPPAEPGPKELNQAEEAIPENLPPSLREKLVKILAQALAQETAILAAGGRRCKKCGVAFLGEGELCPPCRILP